MQWIQRIAMISGIGFLAVSILGFVAGDRMTSMMSMESTAMLLGVFPVNVLHNVAHAAFGIWGLVAARTRGSAINYAIGSGVAYLLLAVAGMLTPRLFGIVPIGGYDIELHLFLAAALAGAGTWATWVAPHASELEGSSTERAS